MNFIVAEILLEKLRITGASSTHRRDLASFDTGELLHFFFIIFFHAFYLFFIISHILFNKETKEIVKKILLYMQFCSCCINIGIFIIGVSSSI